MSRKPSRPNWQNTRVSKSFTGSRTPTVPALLVILGQALISGRIRQIYAHFPGLPPPALYILANGPKIPAEGGLKSCSGHTGRVNTGVEISWSHGGHHHLVNSQQACSMLNSQPTQANPWLAITSLLHIGCQLIHDISIANIHSEYSGGSKQTWRF